MVALWGAVFAMLVGWGLLLVAALRRLGGREAFGGTLSAFQTMWLGYAGVIAFIQLTSIVLPIAGATLIACWVLAIAGFALERRAVWRRLRAIGARPRVHAVVGVAILASTVVVAYAACDLVQWFDTGLYHLQVVRWNETYPAVPGLANLHLRFGYNNSVHAFGALIDTYWQGVAAHIVNGFLVGALLAQWVCEILCARTPRGRLRQVFCMLTLPFLLAHLWSLEIASLSTDITLAVFCYVVALELVSWQPADRRLLPTVFALSLAAVALTTKLGGLATCGVVFVFVGWTIRRAGRRSVAIAFTLPLAIVVGWIIHGVIVSGWLMFPAFGRLPVAWAVPSDVAHAHLLQIESWGRMFGKEAPEVFGHGFWHWFGPWLDHFRMSHEFVLAVVSAALLAWRAAAGPPASWRSGTWVAVVACVLGIAQWFTGAPDLRYGAYLFWLLPAVVFAPMVAGAMRDATHRIVVLVLSLVLIQWGGGFAFHLDAWVPGLFGRPRYPKTPAIVWQHDGEVPIRTPVYSEDAQCWDIELPCAPTVRSLHYRKPGSLASGFLP